LDDNPFLFQYFYAVASKKSWGKHSSVKVLGGCQKKEKKKWVIRWPLKLDVLNATLKGCVKKHEKGAQDQVETPLGNQLLQETNARHKTPEDGVLTSVSSGDDDSDEDAE